MAHSQGYAVKYKKSGFESYYEIWLNEQFQAGPFETLAETARWLETAYQAQRAAEQPPGGAPFSFQLA